MANSMKKAETNKIVYRVGCSYEQLKPEVLAALELMRDALRFDLVVTSAFRSVEHEKEHGRDGTSSHCKGLAVDLAVSSGYERLMLLCAGLSAGFFRVGVGKNFIHFDMDKSKPNPTCWTYYETK